MRYREKFFLVMIGVLSGAAAGMNRVASASQPATVTDRQMMLNIAAGAVAFVLLLLLLRWGTVRIVMRSSLSQETRERFLRYDLFTSLIFLATFLGAIGVRLILPVVALVSIAYFLSKALLLYLALSSEEKSRAFSSMGYLAFLFLISGFAALIYQIIWQRSLFAAYGVNIESITIIVSLFMLGLGLGSILGGVLSSKFPDRAPVLFLISELGIGAFGVVSLPLISSVARATLHGSPLTVSLSIFALLSLPTMLMGATLPILVAHLYRHYKNVGKSVGILYCINTVGSAIACFLTAFLLFALFGQQASCIVAAACNITVGILVSRYAKRIAIQDVGSSLMQDREKSLRSKG